MISGIKGSFNTVVTVSFFNIFLSIFLPLTQADAKEMRQLTSQLNDVITHNELQQKMTHQVKPLVVAIASLEKTMQIQESIYSQQFHQQQVTNDEFQLFISNTSTTNVSNKIAASGSSSSQKIDSTSKDILASQQIINLVEKSFDELIQSRHHHHIVTEDMLKAAVSKQNKRMQEEIINNANVSQ